MDSKTTSKPEWGEMEQEEVTHTFDSFVPDMRICMDGMLTSIPMTRDRLIWGLASLGALLRNRHMNQEVRLGMRKPSDQPSFLGQVWLKDPKYPREYKQVQTMYTTQFVGDKSTPEGEAVQDWFQSLSVV